MAAATSKKERGTHPIATRIREAAKARGLSLRGLSSAAGLHPTSAQKACSDLESGGDVGVSTLVALADALACSLPWLVYGEEAPAEIELRRLPGWHEAAAEARARFGVTVAALEGVGRWRVHERPEHVDALLIAALARAWTASG